MMVDNGTKRERETREKTKGEVKQDRGGGTREWRVEESDGLVRDSVTKRLDGSEAENGSTLAWSERLAGILSRATGS